MQRTMPFHLDIDRHEDKMLRRLGAAFVAPVPQPTAGWNLIEDQAGANVDSTLIARPREEIAELIRQ
jgi:hypothetical protein